MSPAHKAAAERARHRIASADATALVIAEANELLPYIIDRHGDSPLKQARRRRALDLDTGAMQAYGRCAS
jgi:hypothetical protein